MWKIAIILLNIQGTTVAEITYRDYTYATKELCVDEMNDLRVSWRSNLADIVMMECVTSTDANETTSP